MSWSAPASDGGSTITAYTVTSSPGSHTCTWSSGPLNCTVSGLTNGTAYTFTATATNGVGSGPASSPSNSVTPATVDTTPPTVSGPVAEVALNAQLGTSKIPLLVTWSAADPSGIDSYELQQKKNSGSWKTISLPSPTATEVTLNRRKRYTYTYRVRATDTNGNTSIYSVGPAFKLIAKQEKAAAIQYTGLWRRKSMSSAYGHYVKFAKASTARASFAFTGREVAWIAPRAARRGQADVYIDGVYVSTVDLYSVSLDPRRAVFTASWSTSGSHTLEIRVRGTSGRPRVDLDALVVLR